MIFEGTAVAMITPFTSEGTLDEEGMRANINYLIDHGIEGLLAAGTTGESATITHEEQRRMIEILIDEADGRAKTIAGAGSNSTQEAQNLVEFAEDAGADYALVITPYYNKPQQHALINHYNYLTSISDIPLIVYNVPSRTGTDIAVDTILTLAENENIVGLKEANPDLDKVSQIQKGLIDNDLTDKFSILSGNDDLTLPMMCQGATGVISVVGNVDPQRMSDMVRYANAGDYQKAYDLHYELYNLMKVLFIETNPTPTKYALDLMGRPAGPLRMPLAPIQAPSEVEVRKVLEELSLL